MQFFAGCRNEINCTHFIILQKKYQCKHAFSWKKVCVCEREREGERKREIKKGGRERERDTETERESRWLL